MEKSPTIEYISLAFLQPENRKFLPWAHDELLQASILSMDVTPHPSIGGDSNESKVAGYSRDLL